MADRPTITEQEEWRDVPGFEGRYQASTLGRVRRIDIWATPKLQGAKPNRMHGYIEVHVRRFDGTLWRTSAHRLVCMAFHGPSPSDEHEVAHNDGTRSNNRPDNLRWATKSENAADRVAHGTEMRGEKQWKTKLTADDVRYIRRHYRPGYGGLTPFANKYGITRASVLAIVRRRTWKHID